MPIKFVGLENLNQPNKRSDIRYVTETTVVGDGDE